MLTWTFFWKNAPTLPEDTPLFCTECGTKNSADSKYCRECGTKINDGYRTMMLSLDDLRAIDNEKNQERLAKLLDMAFWHNEAGNADAAVLACEAALAIHPHSTTAHSLLGTLYEKRGDDSKAIHHFEAVVSLNPDSAADAAKLDQVRRGVHVKAAAPPPAYKWIPPALARLSVAGVAGKVKDKLGDTHAPLRETPQARLRPLSPLMGSALAFVGALVVGGLLLRPVAPVGGAASHPAVPAAPPSSSVPVLGITPSLAGSAPPVTATALPPVTLAPGASSGHGPAPRFGPDPFADETVPVGQTTPLARTARVSAAPRVPRAERRAFPARSVASLPPLSLRAVPLPGEYHLAPAPVAIPRTASYAPFASGATLPQHTVVVSSLGSAPSPSVFSSPSRIRITIHNASPSGGISLSNRDLPPSDRPNGALSAGDTAQQTAILSQQQGDYRQAASAYREAIRAYQAQIVSGRDVETATRALQACQTGLQICQQSR